MAEVGATQPIHSQAQLDRALQALAGRSLLALDLETTGLDPHIHQVLLITIGDEHEQFVIDARQLSLEPLRPLLEGPALKITHHGAFDLAMLRSLGLRCENVLDTMLDEQVLQNGRREGGFSLAHLSERYLGVPLPKEERLTFLDHSGGFSPTQLRYARRDVWTTFLVFLEQLPKLQKSNLVATARLESSAVPAFADMTYDGLYLDGERWAGLIGEAEHRRAELRAELDKHFQKVAATDLFGYVDLNYESEADLKPLLTRLVGREVRELNKSSLRHLGHPVGEVLLAYREQAKLVSTYGESFLQAIHPRTGRIHAHFQQIGAATGRVSCSQPNLQNIPRGSRFRACFRGPPGGSPRLMITADYSGCELRILAEASADPHFLEIFNRGGDLHAFVAGQIFGVPVSKTENPELRERAKAINFGLAYGMGAGGLAQVTGLPLEEAERLLGRYFRSFPRIQEYLEHSAEQALRRGFAETLGGRRLNLKVSDAQPEADQGALVRVAKNMPIQGTNADMLKAAMAGIRRRLRVAGLDAFIVNTVHDELLVESAQDVAWDVSEIVRDEMIRAGQLFVQKVPVEVDVSVGEAWQK